VRKGKEKGKRCVVGESLAWGPEWGKKKMEMKKGPVGLHLAGGGKGRRKEGGGKPVYKDQGKLLVSTLEEKGTKRGRGGGKHGKTKGKKGGGLK